MWISCVVFLVGLGAGYGICFVGTRLKPLRNEHQELAQQSLDELQGIASRIDTRVTEHTQRIGEIQSGLTESTRGKKVGEIEPQHVSLAANELLEANERLQADLAAVRCELEQQTERLQSQRREARTDALTFLLNRRAFDEELQGLVKDSRAKSIPGALIMIDVDHFKSFNDQYGHQAGDQVLKFVARSIRDTVLGMPVTVARYGGEEFAVLVQTEAVAAEKKLAQAKEIAEQIRVVIESAPPRVADRRVTISLGLSLCAKGIEGDKLVEQADAALYAAKHGGRNRSYFHNGQTCVPVLGNAPAATSTKSDAAEVSAGPQPHAASQPANDAEQAPAMKATSPVQQQEPAVSGVRPIARAGLIADEPVPQRTPSTAAEAVVAAPAQEPRPIARKGLEPTEAAEEPRRPRPIVEIPEPEDLIGRRFRPAGLADEEPRSEPAKRRRPESNGEENASEQTVAGAPPGESAADEPAEPTWTKERRAFPRHLCTVKHRIARFVDNIVPPSSMFFEVTFLDISPAGFSMVLPTSPPLKTLFVVALKKGNGELMLGAEVVNQRLHPDSTEKKPLYVIGCRFTGRVQNAAPLKTPARKA